MPRKPDPQVAKALLITAELFGHTFSRETAEMFAGDLSDYPPPAVLAALARCRKECHRFPSVAQVIERIEDGRPGPEDAWAMIPKDESGSVVWTDEMAEAFGHARSLLPDEVAARMAFRESYTKLVALARARGVQAKWSPSLGSDKRGREAAVEEALRKSRLALEHAAKLLPEPPGQQAKALLTGPDEPPADPARVRQIMKESMRGKAIDIFTPDRCKHEDGPEVRRSTQLFGNQKYLTIYRQCPRCDAVIPKNFPLKEGEDAPAL